jgi:hypothetical protein
VHSPDDGVPDVVEPVARQRANQGHVEQTIARHAKVGIPESGLVDVDRMPERCRPIRDLAPKLAFGEQLATRAVIAGELDDAAEPGGRTDGSAGRMAVEDGTDQR